MSFSLTGRARAERATSAPPVPTAEPPDLSEAPAGPSPVAGHRAEATAPFLLRASAAWSWRIMVVAIAVYALLMLVVQLKVLALSLIGALLLTALVFPFFRGLHRLGLKRTSASAITIVSIIVGFVAIVTFLSATTVTQLPELQARVGEGVAQVREWLATGPLNLNQGQIDRYYQQVVDGINANRSRLATGALSGATLAVEVVSGALLALFATFFFLYDGPHIWNWVIGFFSPSVRSRVDGAGAVAWQTLTGYIRGTILVALVDAVFIGIGLAVMGVPLIAPLVVLTFLGAFIPVVGATLSGIVAVLVAFVTGGFTDAVVIAIVVLVVQQLEGHILQPLVMGKSVRLHPLAIVMAITAGSTLAGVPGAVVAVPVVAVLNRVAVYLFRLRHTEHDEESAVHADDPGRLADQRVT